MEKKTPSPARDAKSENGPPPPEQLALVLTRPMLAVLVGLILAPWLVVAFMLRSTGIPATALPAKKIGPVTLHSVSPTNRVYVSHPGPWGNLEYTRIAIEPPEEFLYVDQTNHPAPRWVFNGFTREHTLELLTSAELTPAQLSSLTQKSAWETNPTGTIISPDRTTVLELGQKSRQKIYSILARFPENGPQNNAYSIRQELVDERFEQSGLSEKTVSMVKRMLYPHGNLMLFGDLELALDFLPDHLERMRLVKSISRRTSLLIRLKIDDSSNLNEIVNYWGFDGRSKDIRPLLESLARIPGGGSVDISHLLPPFARQRIYTYPFPTKDPLVSKRDCHWTSFNFFSDQPSDRYLDSATVRKMIDTEFYPISTGARMGDIVFVMRPTGEIVHSATYIADDIVFTKNGVSFTQPWTYMSIQGLLGYYSAFFPAEQPLEIMYYRRKST